MLKDKRQEIIQYVRDNQAYLEHNHQLYDIYKGNLLPYVVEVMKKTLSTNYFEKIKSRIIPINILERYISKVSGAYEKPPVRIANSESAQTVVDYYVKQFRMDQMGMIADQYSHLFKGYAWEPFLDGEPKLRVLPFDRFLVYSDNPIDPTSETIFIKIIGKKSAMGSVQNIYYTFSNSEVDAFSEDGETYSQALAENNGENPYGVIPFVFGSRAEGELLPIQDTDILEMSKLVSVLLSDISGVSMFQCFSIIYGVDLEAENITMSPNAFWSFKSDPNSDKTPQVGTIKPEADIDKVLNFIVSVFSMWLQTKGVKVNSVGTMNPDGLASGVSKIMDESDANKVVERSMMYFKNDEREFWFKMKEIHNAWVSSKEVTGLPKLADDFDIMIEFNKPEPIRSRTDLIQEKLLEVNAGFKSKRKAIIELNPSMDIEEIEEELREMSGEDSTKSVDNGIQAVL